MVSARYKIVMRPNGTFITAINITAPLGDHEPAGRLQRAKGGTQGITRDICMLIRGDVCDPI